MVVVWRVALPETPISPCADSRLPRDPRVCAPLMGHTCARARVGPLRVLTYLYILTETP